jgi:hypothetical protein
LVTVATGARIRRTWPELLALANPSLAQSNAGSECGFDLIPSFDGNLAAHVRLNLTSRGRLQGQNVASGKLTKM